MISRVLVPLAVIILALSLPVSAEEPSGSYSGPLDFHDDKSPYGPDKPVTEEDFGDTILLTVPAASPKMAPQPQTRDDQRAQAPPLPGPQPYDQGQLPRVKQFQQQQALQPQPYPQGQAIKPAQYQMPQAQSGQYFYVAQPAADRPGSYVLRGQVQYPPVYVMQTGAPAQGPVFVVPQAAASGQNLPATPGGTGFPVIIIQQSAPQQAGAPTQSATNQAASTQTAPTAAAGQPAIDPNEKNAGVKNFVNALVNVGGLFSTAASGRLSAAQPLLNLLLDRL